MRRNGKATIAGIVATVLAALLLSACGSQQGPSPSQESPASQPATRAPESPTSVPVPADEAPTVAALAEDEPPGDVEIGSKVGNRVPDFDMLLADGSTVTTSDLLAANKPVFLMFFASWWPTCRAEFTALQHVYPDYADRIALYAVGVDSFETMPMLEEFREVQGYPWPVALPGSTMLPSLRIFQRSTKVAFDADGTIVYRQGYGQGNAEGWRQLFEQLVSD